MATIEDRIIYADHDMNDIGVLQNFEIDLDIADKKDFSIGVTGDNHVLREGYFWYVEGYEYGGIVDAIESDSGNNTIKYTGRNARGILHSKTATMQSEYVSGENIDECISYIVNNADFGGLFVVDVENISEPVHDYLLTPEKTVYEAINELCEMYNRTLKLAFDAGDRSWHITTEYIIDYSDTVSYSIADAIGYRAEHKFNAPNHIIVHATGEEGEYTIHLYTDENGGIQPYATAENPIEDADYILPPDETQRLFSGIDEYVYVHEMSASADKNYKKIETQPSNWADVFGEYYYLDDSDKYTEYKERDDAQMQYTLLSAKPANWNDNYSEYFMKRPTMTDYEYVSVEGATTDHYKILSKRPNDWSQNFNRYYIRRQSGTGWVYETVSGSQKISYAKMTARPYDWDSNYNNYYLIGGIYTRITGNCPTFKANKFYQHTGGKYVKLSKKPKKWKQDSAYLRYYTRSSGYTKVTGITSRGVTRAPKFEAGKYYRKDTTTVAPAFTTGTFYYNDPTTAAPTWVRNTYYSGEKPKSAPEFIASNSYVMVSDHYAKMVEEGKKKIEELKASTEQTLNFQDVDVDIGDIVGGEDSLTGLTISERITNIIIKITYRDGLTAQYVVGGNR